MITLVGGSFSCCFFDYPYPLSSLATGWLEITAYYAQAFKSGSYPSIARDKVVMWARTHPRDALASQDAVGKPTNFQLVGTSLPNLSLVLCPFPRATFRPSVFLAVSLTHDILADCRFSVGNSFRPHRIQRHTLHRAELQHHSTHTVLNQHHHLANVSSPCWRLTSQGPTHTRRQHACLCVAWRKDDARLYARRVHVRLEPDNIQFQCVRGGIAVVPLGLQRCWRRTLTKSPERPARTIKFPTVMLEPYCIVSYFPSPIFRGNA
jgi:hypothetical protein